MGRIRNGSTRSIALGLVALAILGVTVVAARPSPAGASILFPAISVGANVNLSHEVGNQFEGSVAIDPTDSSRIFALGRDESGNLIGARTSDGGATWISSRMGTAVSSPDHLPPAWGNTSATFDSYGNLFVSYLSTTQWTYTDFGMSTDGGATFTHTAALNKLTDQPVVAAGHGEVWVMYDQGGVNLAQGATDTGPGAIGSFGPAEAMTGANGGAFGDLAIGPQGQVVAAFGSLVAPGPVTVSIDPDGLGPLGFQAAVSVSTTNVGGFDFIPAAPNWGIDAEAHLAWDQSGGPHDGRLYLSYLDAPPTDLGATKLYVMHSDDGGVTWSNPVLVNDDGTNASHFMPGFAVDQTTGAVGATWYDTRGDPTRVSARYYGSVSVDGGDTWSPNFPIATGTSNALLAAPPPTIRNTNWGDYTGLAFQGGVMVPVWADNSNSTGDNPAGANSSFDLYTSLVQVTMPPAAPVVTASPLATTVADGGTYTFTAAASGSPAPTVQWQRSNDNGLTWVPVAGATSTSYTATASAGDQGAQFEAVFTNRSGSATTAPAVLYVSQAPVVTTSPTSTSVTVGANYSFTVTATGQPAPDVQWQRSSDSGVTWVPVSGALTTVHPGVTTSTYTATATATDGGAQFRAVFTDTTGSVTTAAATLSVTMAPSLVSSPVSQTIDVGTTYTFMAVAYGIPAPAAQWERSDDGGLTWSDISGATSYSYPITAGLGDNGAEFRAVFANSAGTVITAVATLGVTTTTSLKLKVAHTTLKGGKKDTLTATVTSPVTGKGKVAGGTVTFSDGPTVVASVPVTKGKASVAVTLAKGSHPLRAVYGGSASVLAGQSQVVTVTAT
jgi:hypothetical protein